MKTRLGLWLSLLLGAAPLPALASGGPVDEQELKCKASSGELIVVRLYQAYSSEPGGDARVFSNANDLGNMLTSMEQCVAAASAVVNPAIDQDLADAKDLVLCGSKDTSTSRLAVRPNNKGFRLALWTTGATDKARLTKNGQAVFQDLTCTRKPL